MAKVKQFGNTWWGKAWLDALEQRALVDPNRLPRGRTYARQERVQDLQVSPGELRATVRGSRIEPYITTLSLRLLTSTEWDVVLDTVMDRASNVAALLAGEVPTSIGDLVLPDRGDLGPECSCPDWAEPCKHAAALCYVAADIFDADPFALLTLRGRSRDEVLTQVRARRSERLGVSVTPSSDQPRGADPGVSAAQAYRRADEPLERSPSLGAKPGSLVTLAVEPGADSGINTQELGDLVNDAAARAWSMLAGGTTSGLELTVGADVVRRAAATEDDTRVEEIATATGLALHDLRAAVAAWRIGGLAGFHAHRNRSELSADRMAPGQLALDASSGTARSNAKIRANTVSSGTTQLRLDDHARWWRFVADDELGWLLVDGPADDPGDLL